ncbi:MAG: 50S ribosomal protein L21 [Candidatus Berkelbacteria bacterium]
MADIAIIKTGGKQYKVEAGDSIKVEKIEAEGKIEFDDILGGKKVTASIVEQGRSKKVDVLKFHSKKRYQRLMGHRQAFTEIKIEAIK